MDNYEGPEFPGGIKVLYKWVSDSLSYPNSTLDWSGRIVVEFDITEEGETANPRIIKGGPDALENEIIKLINKMPNWNPRMSNGKPIKSSYVLPITFKLADEESPH
ncbi:MAG: energy transducer TonB [Muribaculaceae bacterium]|nr:energy transducer TonB [Muribaculaceae bacterium]